MKCQCQPTEAPFLCSLTGCEVTARQHELCAGLNCTARQAGKYRRSLQGKRCGDHIADVNKMVDHIPDVGKMVTPETSKPKVIRPLYPPVAISGPGSELKAIIAELGLSLPGCKCDKRKSEMDRWGVEGCRKNRATIIEWIQESAKQVGWREKIAAAGKAVASGLVVNPFDPCGWLVDEAIRRAEKHPETNWLSTVSIIITARNYGRYLPEAIESALGQSVKCEVIYSDDFSTDDSVAIARRYPIKVITADAHGGVCVARNAGVRASKGELLIHLDGDDTMPPTYAADHLAAFTPGTPFVYGAAKTFGDGPRSNIYWDVKPWNQADIWRGNCVNTSAMYARWAFEKVAGWRECAGSMWDFDLALRAAKLGLPLNSKAVLNYRQHGESVSHQNGEATSEGFRTTTAKQIRQRNADVTVGTIWSGRLPEMVEGWLSDIAESVQHLPRKPNLVILDHSHDAEKRRMLERAAGVFWWAFDGVTIEKFGKPLEFKTEHERRDRVAELLAGANNRLKYLSRDLLWIIEDDVFVPSDAAGKLFDALTTNCAPWKIPHAATGWYVSRHAKTPHYLTGFIRDGKFNHATEANPEPVEVDWSGCGCLMLWRDRTPEFTSHAGKTAAHDWAWSQDLKSIGGTLLAVPVGCRHAVGAGRFV